MSLEQGYWVLYTFETWDFELTHGLLQGYINKAIEGKIESDGWSPPK